LICLFGGTFDPVHLGHVHGARQVCVALDLRQINLVLSARPGHRGAPGASVAHRWRMLQLACADDDRMLADDREIRRAAKAERPSYTVDTLEEIRRRAPDEKLLWVLGSDAFLELPTWHRWRDVLNLAHLVVLQRPGISLEPSGELADVLRTHRLSDPRETLYGGIICLESTMQDISATRVRTMLEAGVSAGDLLPATVYTYIKKHGLYGVLSDV
jgi:nicotinate-nucleotide adenylyltransferase